MLGDVITSSTGLIYGCIIFLHPICPLQEFLTFRTWQEDNRTDLEEIKTIANHFKSKTALDYGSGGSDLNTEEISEGVSFRDYVGLKKIYQFEPARDLKKKGKFDMVLSFDVLEHIFIADLPWVINDIFSKANKCVLINVACYEAAALLPNGENAHITLRHPLWWLGQLEGLSTLHKNVAWGLFTSQDYNEPKFHGIRRMNEIILNK